MNKSLVLLFVLTFNTFALGKIKHVLVRSESVYDQKLCYVGDTGTGKEGQYKVAEAMYKDGCEKIFIAGDLIYEVGLKSTKDKAFKERFLKPYKPLIEKGVTFHLSTGNHDYMTLASVWNKLHKKYDYIIHPNLYYAEVYKDVCFISIDSTSVAHKVHIKKQIKQGLWFDKLQKELKPICKATIALGHHPTFSSGKHGNAKKFFRRFSKRRLEGKFDLYIAGHDHNLSHEGDSEGTTFIVSGSGAKLRALRSKPRGKFASAELGYVVVNISQTSEEKLNIQYQFKGLDKDNNPKLLFEGEKQALGYR